MLWVTNKHHLGITLLLNFRKNNFLIWIFILVLWRQSECRWWRFPTSPPRTPEHSDLLPSALSMAPRWHLSSGLWIQHVTTLRGSHFNTEINNCRNRHTIRNQLPMLFLLSSLTVRKNGVCVDVYIHILKNMKQRHLPSCKRCLILKLGALPLPLPSVPYIYGKLAYLSWHTWMTDSLGHSHLSCTLTFHPKAENLSIFNRISSHHKLPDRWTHPYGTHPGGIKQNFILQGCILPPE